MKVNIFYAASSFDEFPPLDNIDINIDLFEVENVPPINKSKYNEFMDFIVSGENIILMAWRGGKIEDGDTHKSSIELIERLTEEDYCKILKNRAYIVGYSDISYLLCSLLYRNIVCYYGPNYRSTFLSSTNEEQKVTYKYLKEALTKDNYSINLASDDINPDGTQPWIISPGCCTGRLSGGNLDTIYEIINRYKFLKTGIRHGDIVFLEEVDPFYCLKNGDITESSMYKKLFDLKNAGTFESISGLILGRSQQPLVYDEDNNLYYDRISNDKERYYLEQVIKRLEITSIPIIANVSCGHVHPMITLPLGVKATLDTTQKKICFQV